MSPSSRRPSSPPLSNSPTRPITTLPRCLAHRRSREHLAGGPKGGAVTAWKPSRSTKDDFVLSIVCSRLHLSHCPKAFPAAHAALFSQYFARHAAESIPEGACVFGPNVEAVTPAAVTATAQQILMPSPLASPLASASFAAPTSTARSSITRGPESWRNDTSQKRSHSASASSTGSRTPSGDTSQTPGSTAPDRASSISAIHARSTATKSQPSPSPTMVPSPSQVTSLTLSESYTQAPSATPDVEATVTVASCSRQYTLSHPIVSVPSSSSSEAQPQPRFSADSAAQQVSEVAAAYVLLPTSPQTFDETAIFFVIVGLLGLAVVARLAVRDGAFTSCRDARPPMSISPRHSPPPLGSRLHPLRARVLLPR